MKKGELEQYARWFIGEIPNRISILEETVSSTAGFESWKSDYTPASLEGLGEWFSQQIEVRNRTQAELHTIIDNSLSSLEVPGKELTNHTFSLAMDIGMYFSQVFQKNYQSLKWKQDIKNKRFADYGQPLLTGFGSVDLNPVRIVVTLAYALVDKKKSGERLRDLYDIWVQRLPH